MKFYIICIATEKNGVQQCGGPRSPDVQAGGMPDTSLQERDRNI